MAGLLDNFFGNSFDDPKSQAVMALAGGLLSNDWRKGVNGYMQSMAGAGEYETNKKLQQAKMQEVAMKAAAEKQKMDQARAKNEMFMNMFAPSGQSSGQSQSAPQGGLLGDTQGGDPFAGVDKRALMLDYLQNGGKNMGGWVHDRTKPDMQVTSGYAYDKNRLGAGFMPSLTTSTDGKTSMIRIGADGLPVVTAPQGAIETFGAYQGKQADFKPIQVYNPVTERTELQTEGNVIKAAQAPKAMPQRYNGVSGYAGGSVDKANAGALEIMQSELAKPNISQQDREAIGRQIQRIKAQSPQLAQSGVFAAAPSAREKDQQKLVSDNAGKVNDVWLKSSYTPLIESKGALSGTIDSINQTRTAMNAMGGTGWGTETKATAASVLTGLGVGGKNAEMYATNAQTFQQAAMTRLQAELQQQKGPQTEGDSTRQAATYAALKNTPQANAYILDSAQAKAERDLMKARFYESALPIASKKGDLQEIDREWAKRAPSLFSMPSMQKWVKK